MTFNCDICNYETNDRSNYQRHLKSNKHEKKTKIIHSIEDIKKKRDKQLAKKIDQYMQNKYQRQIYLQYVAQIEDVIKTDGKECDADFFQQVISNFETVLSQKRSQKLSKSATNLHIKQI